MKNHRVALDLALIIEAFLVIAGISLVGSVPGATLKLILGFILNLSAFRVFHRAPASSQRS